MNDDAIEQLVAAQALAAFVSARKKAIGLCIANNVPGDAVILMYLTMDSFASLDRDPSHATVCRDDFLRWVEAYLLAESGLACSALDLWAARCGLVHDYSTQSKLIRDGKAGEIAYVWGKRTEEDLRQMIDDTYARAPLPGPKPKALHIEHLFEALSQGIQRFIRNVRADKARQEQVLTRARQLLAHMPGSEWGADTGQRLPGPRSEDLPPCGFSYHRPPGASGPSSRWPADPRGT